jgi:hypothetical protein
LTVDATDFKARFRELACLDDGVTTRWLAEATRYINTTQWGGKADDGLAYLTAHLISIFEAEAIAASEPGAGPIKSEREGSVAVTYAIAEAFTKDGMGSTKYGRRYREILGTIFVTRKI